MLKDVLIMLFSARMQPTKCRDCRQLGMELHQQLHILDAFSQALFLLLQLSNCGTELSLFWLRVAFSSVTLPINIALRNFLLSIL